MPLRKNMELSDWAEILLRRKWFIMFCILLITFAASVYCVVSKEMFKSTSSILVIPQKIPDAYIKSTVDIRLAIEEKINTLQLQVLTKTRLKSIIDELDLFPELTGEGREKEALKLMRKRIIVGMLGSKDRNREVRNVFSIEYAHEDPQVAKLVNSKLTSLFIGENIRRREQQAVGTIELFESQGKEVEKQLEDKDRGIREFRTKYLGELPEQLDSNLRMLERYKEDLKSNRDSIRSAKDRLLLINTQIAELKAKTGIIDSKDATGEDDESQDSLKTLSLSAQIAQKRGMLSQLRLKYTESHPEIRFLKGEIGELEKELKKSGSGKDGSRKLLNEDYAYYSPETEQMSQQIAILMQQKRAINLEIKNLIRDQAEITKLVDLYSLRVENTPKREHQLKELTRDYNNLKEYYEELTNKKMDADLSKSMESREQGEQFQLLEPPSLPSQPYKPARLMVMALAVLLSISAGVGGAIGLEYMDNTIKTPGEFKEIVDIPVLVSLPLVLTEARKRKLVMRKTFLTSSVILYFVAVITFIILYMDKIKVILNVAKTAQ
jgi:polysaccharide chain length determinant protein (PEP-CTERM system associated)